ncbi:PREDICTED: protein SSX3 [Condylura cristata]|uniref:protein SSX3 n=1 Tax=Condylura cristata TaxID=143302 RepID=UPI0006435528|nr:PREDICTED: protein SSX3 [Condylura cristata]
MDKNSSFVTKDKEQAKKLKKCEAFKDISKYFSKEEWGKLGYSEKTTYVYMKRNYETMTGLGLRAALPAFMCPKKQTAEFRDSDADGTLGNQRSNKRKNNIWAYRLRERKNQVVYEEISDPEEED